MSPGRYSRAEAMTYRRFLAARWAAFLAAHFQGEAHVAHVFGVDPKTARNWLAGDNAPSGFAVAYAYARWPVEAAAALREAA